MGIRGVRTGTRNEGGGPESKNWKSKQGSGRRRGTNGGRWGSGDAAHGAGGGLGGVERQRIEAAVEALATLGCQGESLAEVAHDARNMVTALGLYCDLLEEPGVLAVPFAHYGNELRLVAAASRRLVEKLVALDSGAGQARWARLEASAPHGRPRRKPAHGLDLRSPESGRDLDTGSPERRLDRGTGLSPDRSPDRTIEPSLDRIANLDRTWTGTWTAPGPEPGPQPGPGFRWEPEPEPALGADVCRAGQQPGRGAAGQPQPALGAGRPGNRG